MDLTLKENIKDLFKEHSLKPLKRFGQNFLTDKEALNKIVAAAELFPQDLVLEIGPGIGALTQELAKKAAKVIAVEKDRNMVSILKETLKGFNNVEIIEGDIRFLKISNLLKYKVVGNLPFYLTAPVIRKFLENTQAQPACMVLVAQKEVGQRICAQPPRMNLLAVSVQIYSKPEIVSYVSKNSFWPQPKVDAAIIKITPFNSGFPKSPKSGGISEINKSLFFKIVKAGFSQPRKQLINNLSRLRQDFGGQAKKLDKEEVKKWLLKNNVQPAQRAETLTIEDWLRLTNCLVSNNIETEL